VSRGGRPEETGRSRLRRAAQEIIKDVTFSKVIVGNRSQKRGGKKKERGSAAHREKRPGRGRVRLKKSTPQQKHSQKKKKTPKNTTKTHIQRGLILKNIGKESGQGIKLEREKLGNKGGETEPQINVTLNH